MTIYLKSTYGVGIIIPPNEMEINTDRETLYDEVWKDPVSLVAQRYGMSDVGLAKICRKLSIPIPSRGYWTKVKAGKVMKKIPLPNLKAEQPNTVLLTKMAPETIKAKAEIKKKVNGEQKTIEDISVPIELDNPHPLIKAAVKRLNQREGWNDPSGIRSAPDEVLNIQVTNGAIDRATRLTDTLIKRLESIGTTVEIESKSKTTWLDIDGVRIEFMLKEHVTRVSHQLTTAEIKAREKYWSQSRTNPLSRDPFPQFPHHDYTPTGKLTISAGRWPGRTWNDTARTLLDDRLREIINGLLVLAQEIKAKNEEERRKSEIRRLAEERYQFLKTRLDQEKERFNQLEEDAINFERACRLRCYADKVEGSALACSDGLSNELTNWLAWARAKADWLDPLIEISDPILDAPEPKKPGYEYW